MPSYRVFLLGMFGQMAGFNMQMLTRSLLVYRITGSLTAIGIMGLAGAIPHIFAAAYGGVIADRLEKKFVLMAALGGFAALSLFTAVALATGWLNSDTWWILIITAVIQSMLMGILVPARLSIVPAIVGRESLMNAISLGDLAQNGWRLIAPIAAGFIIESFDFNAAYFVIGGLYLWAIFFMAFLPRTGSPAVVETSVLTEVKEGFKYLKTEANVAWVLGLNFFAVVLSMPFQQLLPVFVDDILKVGASGMGILVSVSGAGAILASVILASLPDKKRGLMLIGSTLLLALVLTAFSFSKSWALSLGIMVFLGMGMAGRMSLTNTLTQYYSRNDYHGRLMGIFDMQMSFPGIALYGLTLLAGVIGVDGALGSFGLTLAVIAVTAFFISPRLRRLE